MPVTIPRDSGFIAQNDIACIGENFAWMEGVLVLATIAQHWKFRMTGPRPALDPHITLRPKGGLTMRAERR